MRSSGLSLIILFDRYLKLTNLPNFDNIANIMPIQRCSFLDSTESDKVAKANQEKNKGNEAFKAGDFNEALVYYNRSILLQQSPVLFNNRAITYIKLERFEDAIKDCNKVLAEEPDNFKGIFLISFKTYHWLLIMIGALCFFILNLVAV